MEKLKALHRATATPDPSDPERPLPPRQLACPPLAIPRAPGSWEFPAHALDPLGPQEVGSQDAFQVFDHRGNPKAPPKTMRGAAAATAATAACDANAIDAFDAPSWALCRLTPCALLDERGIVHGSDWARMAADGFVRGALAPSPSPSSSSSSNVLVVGRRLGKRGAVVGGGGGNTTAPKTAPNSVLDNDENGKSIHSESHLNRRAFSLFNAEINRLARRVWALDCFWPLLMSFGQLLTAPSSF